MKIYHIFFKKSVGFITLLILLYNSPIFGIQLTNLVYLFSGIYFVIFKKSFNREQKILILFGVFLVAYGASYTLIREAGDFNMFNFSRLFTSLFSSVLICDCLKDNTNDQYGMVKWIGITAIFQAFIVLLAFFIPEFKTFLLELCGGSERYVNKLASMSVYRGIGWTYAQFSDFAVPEGMSVLCFICYCLSIRFRNKRMVSITSNILFLIAIAAGLLIGRTFQIIIIIGVCYFSYCFIVSSHINVLLKEINRFFIISSIIIVGLGVKYWDEIPQQTRDWAFEMFTNLSDSKKIETSSTDELQTMWVFPDKTIDLLFGIGLFQNPNPAGHPTFSGSDVGIVNSIFYWGILGSILYYGSIILSFRYCARSGSSILLKALSYSLLAVVLIYNIKGLCNGFAYACLIMQWNINYKINAKNEIRKTSRSLGTIL